MDQLMLVTAGVRCLPVSGPPKTRGGKTVVGKEGVCRGFEGGVRLGAVRQGPQGRGQGKEASFARRTGVGTEDSPGCRDVEVTFRDLDGIASPEAGGWAAGRRGGAPCREGLRMREPGSTLAWSLAAPFV